MSNTPKFYDHFVLANMSIQERLGRSGATLNKDSAVFGQQTRSFLQMLNFGNDAITARAASHLLNMDLFFGNAAYLLKLTEGVLLNSIQSITPPKINASTPFHFESERDYNKWSSVGTISLKDGTKANLIVFKLNRKENESTNEYEVLYCAGNYIEQRIDSGFDGYTPGIFAPIYVGETYKSVWSESITITLEMDDGTLMSLKPAWSLNELLAMPDNSLGVLIQNTPRGLTITLGDGEIYGSGYNQPGINKAGISSVIVSYIKCDSLAPVDHATIKFNKDITPIMVGGESVPLLSPLNIGDTADTLRSRSIAEFFAASKITDERDLVNEVSKIPFVKSCNARREYNWPFYTTMNNLAIGRKGSRGTLDQNTFYKRYKFSKYKKYEPGDMVAVGDMLYICVSPDYSSTPGTLNGWAKFMSLQEGVALGSIYKKYYPSACVYDNATIVLSGLVLKSRKYWSEQSVYNRGDVVYHAKTKQLWLALRDGGQSVEPGSEEDIPLESELRFWATREEALLLEEEATQPNNPYYNVGFRFDDYEQLTQAMFESEIKGYFNIAGKLGFTSVVVEPLGQVGVVVDCKYKAPYTMQQQIRKEIEDYVCYHVGKELRADVLNSQLTEKYNLASVYVNITYKKTNTFDAGETDTVSVTLPSATYVPPSMLEVNLQEKL